MRFSQFKRWIPLILVSFLLIQGTVAILAADNPEQTEAKTIVANDKSNQTIPSQMDENNADNQVSDQLKNSPLMFIENVGQFDEQVHFQVRGQQGTFHFANDAVWLTVLEPTAEPRPGCLSSGPHFPPAVLADMDKESCVRSREELQPHSVNLKLSFANANPNPRIVGFEPLDTAVSYFIGNNPDNWQTNVPVYAGVRYEDVYPGVDVEYISLNGHWQAQMVAKPWADLSAVAWQVEGADSPMRQFADALELADDGRLHIETAVGAIELPLLLIDETKIPIQPKPSLHGNQIRQPFTTAHQSQQTAAAAPYRTYLGGSNDDIGLDIAVDDSGAAYVVGVTWSTDFHPDVTNTLQGSSDIFIAKLNPAGDDLVYATYLGGSGHECDTSYGECAAAIAIADSGDVYLTGATWSTDFPTPNGLYTNLGGDVDAFVARLNAVGNQLLYGTYLGGSQPSWSNTDYGHDIAVDSSGYIYVTGETWSNNFPQLNPVKNSPNDETDAFVAKLTPAGDNLVYSTYLGGDTGVNDPWGAYDYGNGIAVDGAGAAYVTGWTASEDLLTGIPVSLQATLGGASGLDHCREEYWCPDAFVIKLGPGGEAVYGTYLGEPGWDEGRGIAIHNNEAYVTGVSGDCGWGGCDAPFVTKLNASGSSIIYRTQINGSQEETSNAIAIDSAGAAYITGHTKSNDFPVTIDAFQSAPGNSTYDDAFVVKLDASGEQVYGTYLGGSHYDYGYGIAVNTSGAYVTGETWSTDFPTSTVALQPHHGGGLSDAFVARFDIGPVITETLILEVLDANGNDVTGLTLNAEGWPISNTAYLDTVANPLTIKTTLSNLEETETTLPFVLEITFSDTPGRFHLFDFTGSPADNAELCWDIPSDEYSDSSFTTNCVDPNIVLQSAESQTYQWQLWIQPSNAAQMQIQGTVLVDGGENTVATKYVDIPQAAIHPAVFVHGILGSMPPRNSVITQWPQNLTSPAASVSEGYLDPFLDSYTPIIENLLKMGYEMDKTLFPVTYDWRQSNRESAAYLHSVLQSNNYVQGADNVSYVTSEDGMVKANVAVHSMGGLVTRSYIEGLAADGSAYEGDINKLVFIATPHRGFPITYNTWEGLSWEDYLAVEVDGWSGGATLPYLTDNLLWPYFVLKQYDPTPIEFCYPHLLDPIPNPLSLQDLYDALNRHYGGDWPDSVRRNWRLLITGWGCPRTVLYDYTHDSDPNRAIGSLPEMLPPVTDDNYPEAATRAIPPYLLDAAGNEYPYPPPSPNGRQVNPLLETHGLNSPANVALLANSIGLENIYVVYGDGEDTVREYRVNEPPVIDPPWLHYWTWQWNTRWQNGEPYHTVIDTFGDNLIPTYSTRLRDGGEGLLPDLPLLHEKQVLANPEDDNVHAGHKGLAYSSEAQKLVGWAFAGLPGSNDSFPFATDYVAPIIGLNNGDALLVFLVWSPVDVLVTDPAGRRIGYDPHSGSMVNEVPGAFYSGNGSDEEFFFLPAGAIGEYTVTTVGTGSGAYAVSAHRVSAAEMRTIGMIGGETQPGQIISQTISYDLTLQSLFFDDMEEGTENWTVSEGWTTITDTAHSLATAWQGTAISNGITLTLDVTLDLSDAGYAQAHFWSRLLPGAAAETVEALVEVSNDGGGTWQTAWRRQPEQLEWTPTELDLLPYLDEGQTSLQLRFRLLAETGTAVWQIDDVGAGYLPTLPEQFSLPFVDSLDTLEKWTSVGDWQPDTNIVHAGTQSWVADDNGASLILARSLEIGAAANPTLAFWTHWTLPAPDAGYIEISPNNGQTWTAVYTQTITTTEWTQVEIPLTNYTGETILARLRLAAPTPANGGEGWWVDDFLAFDKYVPVIHTLPFSDTLATDANWQSWQGWERTTDLAHTGEYAFFADTDRDSLQLVDKLDLTNATTPVLTFWENFAGGQGQLLLSIDNGINWQPVYTRTVASAGWEQASIDLSPFSGEQVQLAFYLPQAETAQVSQSRGIPLAKSAPLLETAPSVASSSSRWPWELFLLLLPALAVVAPPIKRRIPKRRLIIGGILLLLGACMFRFIIYPQTHWADMVRWRVLDRMTEVTGGQVDVVVPASTYIGSALISPDGCWLYWGVPGSRTDIPVPHQRYLLNLETGEQSENLTHPAGNGSRWITSEYLAIRGNPYLLLHVPDFSYRELEVISPAEANETLRDANDVYVIKGFNSSGSGTGLLSLDPAFPYAVREHVERDEVMLDYTYMPGLLEGYEDGIASPDGAFIAIRKSHPTEGFQNYLEIQTATGEIIATAFARDRSPRILGWGADGRSVYFSEHGRAGASDVERPIFKLTIDDPTSMTTPEKSSIASYRRAAQVNPSGWYIDDILVEDRGATPNIDSYIVFGLNSVWLRHHSQLHSGHVGALDASSGAVLNRNSEVTIGKNVIFHDLASTIMGDSVTLKRKADVNDIYYNEIDIANNAVYSETITPLIVPLPITLPPFPEITPGSVDYTVARNDSLELPAGAYGSVTMKKNSVLTLTGGIYQFENINIGRESQLLVTAPTEIRIATRLEPGNHAVIGPAAGIGLKGTDLVIFVAGVNGANGGLNSAPKTAVIGQNNILTATIYAPNGTLWIKAGTTATGSFIARDVRIGNHVQLWLAGAFGED